MNKFYNEFSKESWLINYKGPDDETIDDTFKRLAKSAASIENKNNIIEIEKNFLSILDDFKFIPGGRIMANLGINSRKNTTLMNCFVHHPSDINLQDPDSIDGIYNLLKAQAHTLKSEGGYGINASFIRPNGMYIKGIGSRTPGVISFMGLWNKSSEIITSGSDKLLDEIKPDEKKKIRKGAQMLILNIWHPDILEFIKAKQNQGILDKFNISVGITDGFMKALKNDKNWNLEFPDVDFEKYKTEWFGDLENWKSKGYPTKIYDTLPAKDLWEEIMKSTYNRNDPGIIFLDLVNKLNPLSYAETVHTTNPCGEIPMSTGVCNLGSINLVKFWKNDEFDFEEFKRVIKYSIRFLDNINDISSVPLKEYKDSMLIKRRIGLGVMGLGSLLFMMKIKYGSKDSLHFINKLYKIKTETELLESAKLGKEKGSFKLFNKEKHFNTYWWKNLKIDKSIKNQIEEIGCMRNSHTSMNAPTGNTSIYAGCVSGGIEPVFMKEYIRWSIVPEYESHELKKKGLKWPNALKGEWFETDIFKFSKRGTDDILKGTYESVDYEIDKNRGLIKSTKIVDYGWQYAIDNNYDLDNEIFSTTEELNINDHINVLKVISHYTNMNNSKTVNIPNDYNYDNFKELYMHAYDSNIKGITTYRAGTMTAVLESINKNKQIDEIKISAPKRPKILPADIFIVNVKSEKFIIVVGKLNNAPYEIFGGQLNGFNFKFREKQGIVEKVKRGQYKLTIGEDIEVENFIQQFSSVEQDLFRLTSLSLRHNVPIKFIMEQLQKSSDDVGSLTAAASRVFKKYIKDGEEVTGSSCPNCNNSNQLVYAEGCISCKSCGWSKC